MWIKLPALVLCSWGLGLHTWSLSVKASLPQPPLTQSSPLREQGRDLWLPGIQRPLPSLGHQGLAEGSCGLCVRSTPPSHVKTSFLIFWTFIFELTSVSPAPVLGRAVRAAPGFACPDHTHRGFTLSRPSSQDPGSFASLLSAQSISQDLLEARRASTASSGAPPASLILSLLIPILWAPDIPSAIWLWTQVVQGLCNDQLSRWGSYILGKFWGLGHSYLSTSAFINYLSSFCLRQISQNFFHLFWI